MTWHLVTFANDKFLDKQKYLHEIHEEEFCHHAYNREWLESTDFYAQNKELLDAPVGDWMVGMETVCHFTGNGTCCRWRLYSLL